MKTVEDVIEQAVLDVLKAEGFASFVDAAKLKGWAKFVADRLRHAGKIKS